MPLNVIAGCSASGIAPRATAGPSTRQPYRPQVCTTSWPGCQAPVEASPAISSPSASSGTASSTSSARSTTSGTGSTGTPGSNSSARSRLAADTADTPTTA